MATLNQSLDQTTHESPLLRKASRLGFSQISEIVQLAVQRGCTHYRNTLRKGPVTDPGSDRITNEELVILLIHGGQRYEPTAIRCAAQLLRAPGMNPGKLAFLALKERCETTLHYLASMGLQHDSRASEFWKQILEELQEPQQQLKEGILPHYSRFMLNPGLQRGGPKPAFWLSPTP